MSPEDNTVLSQEDIDAMMPSAAPGGGDSSPPAEEASSPEPAVDPPAADPPAAAPAADGGAALAEVAQRLDRLEAAVGQISQAGGADGRVEANMQTLAQHLQALSSRVEEIAQNLPNTLGYGARASFQCTSCSTQGAVASRVYCTHCGADTALGWWPS